MNKGTIPLLQLASKLQNQSCPGVNSFEQLQGVTHLPLQNSCVGNYLTDQVRQVEKPTQDQVLVMDNAGPKANL